MSAVLTLPWGSGRTTGHIIKRQMYGRANCSLLRRVLLELTSTGPLPVAASAARPRRPPRPARQGPTHVYRCPYCRKTFNRRTMDSSLNPHNDPRGYPCPGRVGVCVRTNY